MRICIDLVIQTSRSCAVLEVKFLVSVGIRYPICDGCSVGVLYEPLDSVLGDHVTPNGSL